MRKFLLILSALTIITSIAGYIFTQRYLLPLLSSRIETQISGNTPYKIKIKNPVFEFTKVLIPEILINYKDKEFSLKKLTLNPAFIPLFKKELILKGKAKLHVQKEEISFKIEKLNYRFPGKKFILNLYFPSQKASSYLNTVSYLYAPQTKNIEIIQGKSTLKIFIEKTDKLKLHALLEAKDIFLKYKKGTFILPALIAEYKKIDNSVSLRVVPENLSFIWNKNKTPFLKGGNFILKTDLQNLEISHLEAKIDNIPWQGKLLLKDLKITPILLFDLNSTLCHLEGKVKKQDNLLMFKCHLTKESSTLSGEGSYDMKENELKVKGEGETTIATLLSYLPHHIPDKLKYINGDLNIKSYILKYNKTKKLLTLHSKLNIQNLIFKNITLADKSIIDLDINNRNLTIKKLLLKDGSGRINVTGFCNLEGEKYFQSQMTIENYSLGKLVQIFTPRDIGDASLFLQAYLEGKLKQLDSLRVAGNWRFKDGKIGKLTFLSQIAMLFGKPELEEIAFNSGEGKIQLLKKTLEITPTILYSPYLNLYISGAINLKGDLDLTLFTEFPQQKSIFEPESPWGKIGSILFKGVEEMFYKIIVTGNIKKPKYTLVPATIDKIFNELLPIFKN